MPVFGTEEQASVIKGPFILSCCSKAACISDEKTTTTKKKTCLAILLIKDLKEENFPKCGLYELYINVEVVLTKSLISDRDNALQYMYIYMGICR